MALSDLTKKWEGYDEQFKASGASSTIVYHCAWPTRSTCVSDLIGVVHSDYSFMFCTDVSIEKVGDADTGSGGPVTAKLTASFATRNFGSNSQQDNVTSDWSLWAEHWEGGGEGLTIGLGFRVSDAVLFSDCTVIRKDDNVPAVKIFPSASITISGTTDKMDKAVILDAVAKLNDAATTIKGFAYPAEQLLFLGADMNEGTNSEGAVVNRLSFKWAYKHSNTWNEFWWDKKSGGPGFIKLIDSNGNSPYETTAMSDLDPQYWS